MSTRKARQCTVLPFENQGFPNNQNPNLALPLFMAWVGGANYRNNAVAFYDFAVAANLFN